MAWASWLYVSTSRLAPAEAMTAVDDIVAISRPRNARLEVTGALMFTGTRFVQLLEGPPQGVAELQASIFRDPRHEAILTISSRDVVKRTFSDWALAYAGPSRIVVRIVEQAISHSENDPSEGAKTLVELLKQFSPLP